MMKAHGLIRWDESMRIKQLKASLNRTHRALSTGQVVVFMKGLWNKSQGP